MQKNDGMNYAPEGKAKPVVGKGEFIIAAIGLDHGHINGMCNGLLEAGAELKWVYDSDPGKAKAFQERYPQVKIADSEEQVLQDPEVRLVASAKIPSERCALGMRVMDHGKDYFTDKPPLTSLEQLAQAREKVAQTGQKYAIYYSERLHSESSAFVGQLIKEGKIGRVLQVIGLGPHKLSKANRPDWFFKKEQYGGILCDLGSHHIEQYLAFSGAKDARVVHSKVANYNNPDHPELEDFGDATLVGDNGSTSYLRVDWFTADGLPCFGDGKTIVMGTEGTIEMRKYIDVGRSSEGDQVYLVNHEGMQHFSVKGKVGYPFFGKLILDCLNRTEEAMTQEHAFKAAELCLLAQKQAITIQ